MSRSSGHGSKKPHGHHASTTKSRSSMGANRARRRPPSPLAQARVPILVIAALAVLAGVRVVAHFISTGTAPPIPTQPGRTAPAQTAATPPGQAVAQPPIARPAFDGEAAFGHLKAQCDFGVRVPGTDGHRKCREFLVATLKPLVTRVEEQSFDFRDGSRDVRMTNVIARLTPASGDPKTGNGVILAAHWDTRPTADQEPDLARRRQPIPGANDGASGVAVLLELARQFKTKPPAVPVWLVFFDGEDYGPGLDRMFLGAKYFAAHLPEGVPTKGILLDMIGDKELGVFKEVNSAGRAGTVVDSVWDTAARLGYRPQFDPAIGHTISDDHLPLLDKGIAMIDIIDFDYPYWHTLGDTVDKCAPSSLKVIGEVVGAWVYSQR